MTTFRGRVLAAFQGEPTDKVPVHHIGFSSQVGSMILGREAYVGGGIQQWRESRALMQGPDAHQEFLDRSMRDALALAVATDQDIIRWEYWRVDAKPAAQKDEYTFVYGDPDGDWKIMQLDPQTELYQLIDQHCSTPRPAKVDDLEHAVREQERQANEYRPYDDAVRAYELMQVHGEEHVLRFDAGPFGIPYDNPLWLEAVLVRPDLVTRYLDAQVQLATLKLEALASSGVMMAFGGCDFASNKGPFFSPQVFVELFLPRLVRLTQTCHDLGMYYLFASDGNLWPVADDLLGVSGVDGYHEIDRRAGMDLRKLRDQFPQLTLVGNISSHSLHRGTKDDVVRETLSCIEEAKRSGHIVVGLSNYAQPGTPEQNVHAMLDTIRKHR